MGIKDVASLIYYFHLEKYNICIYNYIPYLLLLLALLSVIIFHGKLGRLKKMKYVAIYFQIDNVGKTFV